MLESMTIMNKGGLILYQYTANPSIMDKENAGNGGPSYTQQVLQKHWIPLLVDPATPQDKTYYIKEGITFCWKSVSITTPLSGGSGPASSSHDLLVVAVYPDILFEGPRQYLQQWAQGLVQTTALEYYQFYQVTTARTRSEQQEKQQQQEQQNTNEDEGVDNDDDCKLIDIPDPTKFDNVFRVLLDQSKTQKQSASNDNNTTMIQQEEPSNNNNDKNNNNKGGNSANNNNKTTTKGKEKRQWHDGKAKVTKEAMEGLDMSKKESESDKVTAQDRALREAKAAYLPTEEDLQLLEKEREEQQRQNGGLLRGNNNNDDDDEGEGNDQSMLGNFFAHLTGTKKITDDDLNIPLNRMHELLTSKNVASEIATTLVNAVRLQLRGKTLRRGYRVVTAVKQALQSSMENLLARNQVDLLQNVVNKRKSNFSSIMFSSQGKKTNPYVIAVIGINGVGKSTSLAKMTYYLKENGCSPLLVAGDTFRSGAVEQLSVHAQCLDVPIFSQGYAKDPSAVAKAAIKHATEQGNDVVLIDTAGRMQNNAPLMKALGKMISENQPDFIILVCEALVGHDGLDQFKMFSQALGYERKLDGLLLTKFDTVSDKVGAALTLTHETGAPVVFCGTGQKYHHLQKLQASKIIQALFS